MKLPITANQPSSVTDDSIPREYLESLVSGDHQAFEHIYLHYARPVKDFLYVFIGSDEEAREITQQVFVSLWEKREKIDPGKNIAGYLYTIARNLALNHFEHRKVVDKFIGSHIDWSDTAVRADELLIAKEKELLLEMLINSMPPQRRKIYEMSRIDQLTNGEIAARLNISKNTVENHISSALKDLRKLMYLFLLVLFNF